MNEAVRGAVDGGGRYRLRAGQRLKEPDFKRVFAGHAKASAGSVLVFFCPNGLNFVRLGTSVGRKHGNAVARNRIKRIFRTAFRLAQHALPVGFDYVLLPKKGAAGFEVQVLCDELKHLGAKLLSRANNAKEVRKAP